LAFCRAQLIARRPHMGITRQITGQIVPPRLSCNDGVRRTGRWA
jgi:hypothetical protein